MRTRASIRPAAQADLDYYAAFIGRDSIDTALRFLDSAETTFRFLVDHPLAGACASAIYGVPDDLRVWRIQGFPNHLVFYRLTELEIEFVRILHASQDIRRRWDENP